MFYARKKYILLSYFLISQINFFTKKETDAAQDGKLHKMFIQCQSSKLMVSKLRNPLMDPKYNFSIKLFEISLVFIICIV